MVANIYHYEFVNVTSCVFDDITGNSVTCDVTSVEPLVNTSITCHFPEDVSQTRRIVTVSHFKGNNYRGMRIHTFEPALCFKCGIA